MKNRKVQIVVLDTGICPESQISKKGNVKAGFGFYCDEKEEIRYCQNAIDDIGHGTAVASIIEKNAPDVEIIPIKIVEQGVNNGASIMIAALNYIYENIDCDIINISAGIVCCDEIESLKKVCERLTRKGIIIISAFDNQEVMSYPAAFECVIGIDGVIGELHLDEYICVKNSVVNYVGEIRDQKVPWLHGQKNQVSGTSFLAPLFTAKIADLLKDKKLSLEEIKVILNKNAVKTIELPEEKISKMNFEIKKAIVFPFNKEMHSLARFSDLLNFEILDFYDTKFSGNMGKGIRELQQIDSDIIIKNYDNIDWNAEFDTIILGHVGIISRTLKRDFESEIIEKCRKYKKNLFSCKDISVEKDLAGVSYYIPKVEEPLSNLRHKCFVIGCPILGIVGTSSRQGKFTLQLKMRREFLKRGYHIGQLGTEPTSLLYGMDEVYPMGYETSVYAKGSNAVYEINQMLGRIEKKHPDLIIFGSQAHTVPYMAGSMKEYPIMQHELILGTQADAYILCVSMEDDFEYIKRTKMYLESIYESEVIAIVVSRITMEDRWSTISAKYHLENHEISQEFAKKLADIFNIPVYILDEDETALKVVDACVKYFSE